MITCMFVVNSQLEVYVIVFSTKLTKSLSCCMSYS